MTATASFQDGISPLRAALQRANVLAASVPPSVVALVARVSLAATFWKSGQTKVQGLAIDLVEGRFEIGLPRLADQTIDLFRDEYRLPLLPPEVAALAATAAEHVFPRRRRSLQ